ncbi:MAG TPA: hypothetical protein VJS45_04780 [Acidimicrobiia bacterium]|nr:hypothetical protein [Acidimicrobiia bacterium]
MTRKTLVIALVLAAASLLFPSPAGATVGSVDDPTGDAKGGKDARADITKVGISYVGGTITLATSVVNPEAPTSKNWIDGDTSVEWTIFHPDGGEYWANFSGFASGPDASLWTEQDKELCKESVKPAFVDGKYTVSFPASCLNNPPKLTISGDIAYDDIASGRGKSEDAAPDDEGECCEVTPS